MIFISTIYLIVLFCFIVTPEICFRLQTCYFRPLFNVFGNIIIVLYLSHNFILIKYLV